MNNLEQNLAIIPVGKLPVKFPEERIERLILTSTKAYNEALDLAGGVQITNLENLSEILNKW